MRPRLEPGRYGAPDKALPFLVVGRTAAESGGSTGSGGDPSVLLAGEPTGNLDSKNGEAVMELLHDVHAGGATICMVTHDQRFESYDQRKCSTARSSTVL